MTKKHWLIVGLVLVLAALSLYSNRDWFAKDVIQISHRSRSARVAGFGRRRPDTGTTDPIVFLFTRKLKFTSIKVIPVSEIATNKFPHPIWQLVSESNSVPVKDFMYGGYVPGMHPKVPGATPDPLEPDIPYRLLVEAGTFKGEHDFVPSPRTP